jgi:outer membrane protein
MKMKSYIKIYISLVIALLSIQVNAQRILTKKEALQTALENNYGIKIANNTIKIAENNSSIYNSGFLPLISTSAGANYNVSDQEIGRQDGTITSVASAETETYNASINLNYTIFDGLGRKYNYKQLQETYNITAFQARETIENTYLQLFNVYFQIARLSENTKNLKKTLAISKQRLQRAQYQHDYGQSTKLELLNAEVDVNNDSINLINTEQQFITAKRDLNIILGVKQDVDYDVETEVDFAILLSFEELLSKATTSNVVLKQQEKNIEISKYAIKANRGGYLPSVGLTSSYGWNKSINPSTSFLASSTVTGLNAGVNLSWNIFDGGNTKTRVANAKITLENQEILKQQQTETVENSLKNMWGEYHNKLYILKAQEQNVITAQNNFDRTQELHKLGQLSSIEFRQAQINLLNTQNAQNNAKYDAKLIELELLQLSGQILDIEF